jgi:S-methylmethionine-dependent homocysteine/selenocysteine methylase
VLLLVETNNRRQEAELSLAAAVATGLPAWCSLVTDGAGLLLSGERLEDVAPSLEDQGAAAVLLNCIPVIDVLPDLLRLRKACRGTIGAYGNIGHASDVDGWRVELMLDPSEFARHLLSWRAAGAELLGGCCGTEPRHLKAAAALFS